MDTPRHLAPRPRRRKAEPPKGFDRAARDALQRTTIRVFTPYEGMTGEVFNRADRRRRAILLEDQTVKVVRIPKGARHIGAGMKSYKKVAPVSGRGAS